MKPGWQLIDSVARAREAPARWVAAPEALKQRIAPGFFVKIGVHNPSIETGARGERFWAWVLRVEGEEYEVKVTQSDLVVDHGITNGAVLKVQFKHVFGILAPDFTPMWENRSGN